MLLQPEEEWNYSLEEFKKIVSEIQNIKNIFYPEITLLGPLNDAEKHFSDIHNTLLKRAKATSKIQLSINTADSVSSFYREHLENLGKEKLKIFFF
jgi:hypothetical protein